MKSSFVIAVAVSVAAGFTIAAPPNPSAPPSAASRLGVGWAFLYGYQGVKAETFLPEVRRLGGGFAKVYLFWNQVEPEPGRFDWTAVDAFVDQLQSPEEGLIAIYSNSTWATAQPSTMIPASPAKNPDDYYRFIHDLVARYKGRVRYWQNDCEPNNPVFWSGSKEQFVDQLKIFHSAVKAADPEAVVVAGGYDGLFNPPGTPPHYNQQAGIDFFDHVLDAGRDAFDVFDLRLYADPYTIPARVEIFREKMRTLGYEKPIFSTEYGGPGFFAFPTNRRYIPLVAAWNQAAATGDHSRIPDGESIEALYSRIDELPPETQMFLMDCSPELDAKLQRLQSREIAIRNVLALSAGVERTSYWQLLTLSLPRDNFMQLMYGKIGLVALQDGAVKHQFPTADAFQRTARALAGVQRVERIEVPDQTDVYFFLLQRGDAEPGFVIWQRRDTFTGEDQPPTQLALPWTRGPVAAHDVLGKSVPTDFANGKLTLPVSVTPIFLEPRADE